jgi:iron(III) transport system substrate-binding protein
MRTLPIFALALFLAACGGDGRSETLVVYSPHGKEMLRHYEKAFEAAYPEVDVQWIDLGGQDAYDRVRTERQNPQASIWWGGDSPTFAIAADEGLFEPYQPSWSGLVPSTSHDSLHRWYAPFRTPEVIMYNTDAGLDLSTIDEWDDLIQTRHAGRILIRYPLNSSTMRTIWGAMITRQPTEQEGYDWLARLDRNTKTYTADPTQLYLRLARGEADVTLWNLSDVVIQRDLNGYPFDFIIPESGTPVLYDGIALVANGPNPERAKQFYEFVTSDSALVYQANNFARLPTRSDIAESDLPEWMQGLDIREMPMDWERLAREGSDWMQYWDENIKGRGGQYLARGERRAAGMQ